MSQGVKNRPGSVVAEAIGAKYRQMVKEDDGHYRPYWPNRSGGRVAAPVQATTNWAGIWEALYYGFIIIGSAAAIVFCLAYIKMILVGLFFLLCVLCQPRRGRPRKYW